MGSDNGARSSAVIYSLTETAKANNLYTYKYLEMLLSAIPEHMDDKDMALIFFPGQILFNRNVKKLY